MKTEPADIKYPALLHQGLDDAILQDDNRLSCNVPVERSMVTESTTSLRQRQGLLCNLTRRQIVDTKEESDVATGCRNKSMMFPMLKKSR